MFTLRLAGLALIGALVAACGSGTGPQSGDTAPQRAGALRVVAGVNVWGDVARQIGGGRVSVTSLISDPNVDPHQYESSAANAAALADASLVILNGLGYDDFAGKLLAASPRSGRVVLTVADAVHPSGDNPHLWYSPAYVAAAAQAIEARLTQLDPAGRTTYSAGLKAFLAGQSRVTTVIGQIRARYAGTAVAYTERVPAYLVAAAGLRLGVPASFAQAIEDGTDPTPHDTAAFHDALSRHTVRALLYNTQAASPATRQIRTLAEKNKVPVVDVTETLPPDEPNIQSWQASQAQALLAALGG